MTVDEMKDALTKLGIEYYSSRGDEVQAACPAHKERVGHEDHNPSFWINADNGAFICFSCQWKGNLYTLISYTQGINIDGAKDWLGSTASLSSRLERVTKSKAPVIREMVTVTESMLSAFTNVPDTALFSRGLTKEAAFEYGLLWDVRSKNWIIPIRDLSTNQLLGWQEKGYDHRYFNNRPAGVQKSQTLFGHRQYTGGDMIVVESPLDVVRLASLGITGGVATYGSLVSMAQFHALRGADRLIIAMDNDAAGQKSSLSIYNMCKQMDKEAWFFNYNNIEVKDIGGMSLDEIRFGLDTARHIIKGMVGI
jgi:DNA primase